ncbi:SagB-type dehydrogenase domain-containing protein [Micromonospora echinaurantiaca]|uniref:SagB-type dehydrogenase domain-containing protein n=1 Tax=Micromonospora echinaurantiaca TaxID=47857 RepID=A0A1C5HKX1_9ACTN|nr:nitroreductase family protein [Micromonospora echinaurantiaca]SCG46241.1 SagB-type dehydrogenase domain-containing protein [Micromonospora echinaurantiaca]
MQQQAIEVVRDYAGAVFRRARVPMEPLDYEVDWVDQPSRHTSYPGAPRVPLPADLPALPTLRELFTGEHPPPRAGWSLPRLATLLRLSYGVLDRRLTVNWNQDVAKRTHFEHAVWGRGTASGGGMYPVELYLVSGASGPLLPGVYHYHTGQHVLERLLLGDVTGTVRGALDPAGRPTGVGDSFLLAAIRFWKNSFKYNSFCYHVVTQDLGALLGSWELLADALGVPLRRLLCFDPAPLDRLLGFDSDQEGVFAVVPIEWSADRPAVDHPAAGYPAAGYPAAGHPAADRPAGAVPTSRPPGEMSTGVAPTDRGFGDGPNGGPSPDGAGLATELRVRYPAFERSRQVRRFPAVTAVHGAAAMPTRPAPGALADAAPRRWPGEPVALPEPALASLDRPLSTVLASRSSSFGRFRRPPELTAAELGTTLAFAAAGRPHPADADPVAPPPAGADPVAPPPADAAPLGPRTGTAEPHPAGTTASGRDPGNGAAAGPDPAGGTGSGGPALTRLWVFANHVDGLATGSYAYCPRRHALLPAGAAPEGGMSAFLQQQYFLTNYTMGQVGAVLAVSGRLDAVLDAVGPRGYRILNAEIGAVAQRAYCAATAQRIGCGAVLGFDNVAMDEALGLTGTDERTVLFLLLGRHPDAVADLAYRL